MAIQPLTLSPELQNIPVTSGLRGKRFLTCQGGGVKGGAFSGCAEILEQTGILSQIEEVAGSSAGAIFATLLAVGYTAKEIKEIMEIIDFRRFMDKDAPGWIEATGISNIISSFSDKESKEKGKLPEGVGLEDIVGLAFSKKLGLWKGDALLTLIQRLIARKTGKPNITFKELAELAKLKPGMFRALTLTGSNLTTGELEHYNARDWPDMPIFEAVRISASFPGAFMPYKKPILKRIVDGVPEYSEGVRVDGGLLENLPDVFNKPPYFSPKEPNQVNPEVLALSFKESAKDKQNEITSGMQLLKKTFKALLSEKQVREKYEKTNSIVYIDPVGVDTLEFDASKERRDRLVRSGWDSVEKTLIQFLNSEKKVDLNKLDDQELIRLKVYMLGKKDQVKNLTLVNNELSRRKKNNLITQAKIDELFILENEKKDRLLSYKKEREDQNKNIIIRLNEKVNELENIKNEELTPQIKELRLVLAGLELQKISFLTIFNDKKTIKEISRQLSQIKEKNKKIFEKQNRITEINNKINEIVDKLEETELKFIEESLEARTKRKSILKLRPFKNYSKNEMTQKIIELRMEISNLEKDIKEDLHERDKHLDGIQDSYNMRDNIFLCHYFKEIKNEFSNFKNEVSKTEEERYYMPGSPEHIQEYLKNEVAVCETNLKEALRKIKETNVEIQNYKERIKQYEKHSVAYSQYETLKTLQSELDKSIYDKTSFIAKINSYFISDKPSAKNFAVTLAMQAVAVVAFVIRAAIAIPIGIVASIFIPGFLKRFAELVYNKNKQGKEKMMSDRFINAFSMPDLFKINKLKYLAKVTADAVTVLDKNYAKADTTEHSYIFRMFQFYLKDTGLKLEDIFPIKEEDTKKSYEEMINKFMKDLAVDDPEYFKELQNQNINQLKKLNKFKGQKIKIDRDKFPIYRNFEEFYEKVNEKIKTSKAITIDSKKTVKHVKLSNRNSLAMQTFIKVINESVMAGKLFSDISWKNANIKRARDDTMRIFKIIGSLGGGAPAYDEGMLAEAYVDSMQTLNSVLFKNKVKSGHLDYFLTKDDLIENGKPKIPAVIKRLYLNRVKTIYNQSGLKGLNDTQIRNYVQFSKDENLPKEHQEQEILNKYLELENVIKLSKERNIENAKREFIKSMDQKIQEYRLEKREFADMLSGEQIHITKPVLLRQKGMDYIKHKDIATLANQEKAKEEVKRIHNILMSRENLLKERKEPKVEKELKEGLERNERKEEKEIKEGLERNERKVEKELKEGLERNERKEEKEIEHLNKEERLVLEYVNNAKDLNLPLPDEIKRKFSEVLKKADKNEKLEQEILRIGFEFPVVVEHFEIELPANIKSKRREFEAKVQEHSKSAIENAMTKFYQRRAEERELLKKGIKSRENGGRRRPGMLPLKPEKPKKE